MSIATEITRLQTAKADIKTAIEAKGVTVPSNATLDTYDTYVSQISSGGGTNYLEQYANKTISGAISSTQLGTNIGSNMSQYLFYKQPNITSVDLTGTGTTEITANFCNNCSNLASITIPSTVTRIGSYFLSQCTAITSVTIPSSVAAQGSMAGMLNHCLDDCTSLTQVICNAVSGLPQYFCTNCPQLALVDLGSSVDGIASRDFQLSSASTDLLEVVLRKTDAIVALANAIGSTSSSAAFGNRQNIKIYVPTSLKASYEADSNWAAGVTKGYLTIAELEGSQYE